MKINRQFEKTILLSVMLTILCSAIVGCGFFPESTFELSNQSRLPKWFRLSPGLARSDVSVTMNYYVKPWGRSATFILHDKKNNIIAKTTGKMEGAEPLHLKSSLQSDASGYPFFELITTNGIKEIIEHKKLEPIFYITDDPAVRTELIGVQTLGMRPGH